MDEVEVVKNPIVCVQDPKSGSFKLMRTDTREVWPITKEQMLWLAENLESWFREISKETL